MELELQICVSCGARSREPERRGFTILDLVRAGLARAPGVRTVAVGCLDNCKSGPSLGFFSGGRELFVLGRCEGTPGFADQVIAHARQIVKTGVTAPPDGPLGEHLVRVGPPSPPVGSATEGTPSNT